MLNPSAAQKRSWRAELEQIIDVMGVPATWTQAKPPHATKTGFKVGFKTAGLGATEIINAYGLGAKVITFKQVDFPTQAPEKFDEIQIHDEVYTLEDVFPHHDYEGKTAFYKGYVRGK